MPPVRPIVIVVIKNEKNKNSLNIDLKMYFAIVLKKQYTNVKN